MKCTQIVKVKNKLGLHARPASLIAKRLQSSQSEVQLTHKNMTVNAKSIMSILMLAARQDAEILITVDGEDAKDVLTDLTEAFHNAFGEKT